MLVQGSIASCAEMLKRLFTGSKSIDVITIQNKMDGYVYFHGIRGTTSMTLWVPVAYMSHDKEFCMSSNYKEFTKLFSENKSTTTEINGNDKAVVISSDGVEILFRSDYNEPIIPDYKITGWRSITGALENLNLRELSKKAGITVSYTGGNRIVDTQYCYAEQSIINNLECSLEYHTHELICKLPIKEFSTGVGYQAFRGDNIVLVAKAVEPRGILVNFADSTPVAEIRLNMSKLKSFVSIKTQDVPVTINSKRILFDSQSTGGDINVTGEVLSYHKKEITEFLVNVRHLSEMSSLLKSDILSLSIYEGTHLCINREVLVPIVVIS